MSIELDGIDDRVRADISLSSYPVSISCQAKINDASQSGAIISVGDFSVSNRYLTFGLVSGQWFITARNGTSDDVLGGTASLGWHHFVAVFASASDRRLYVDNSLEVTGTVSKSFPNPTRTLFGVIREPLTGAPFDGQITEVAGWDIELFNDDRSQLFNTIKGRPMQIQFPNLIKYHPMDDESDGSSADGAIVRDLSGNGNDGLGDNGANNTGLTFKAEEVLTYPASPIILNVPVETKTNSAFLDTLLLKTNNNNIFVDSLLCKTDITNSAFLDTNLFKGLNPEKSRHIFKVGDKGADFEVGKIGTDFKIGLQDWQFEIN